MENNFIINYGNNSLSSFNFSANKIFVKNYVNEIWEKEVLIIDNVRNNFTVSLSSDGKLYLFCQDIDGNVILSTNTEGRWTNKIILENQSPKATTILFYPIITEKGITLIYNSPIGKDGSGYIMMQKLADNGTWAKAETIDKFYPIKSTYFTIQKIKNDHYILFYQTKTTSKNIGYREITSNSYGSFNVFHTTNYQLTDFSYLTTNEGLYLVNVVKSMYSTQLIFRKKDSDNFSNPIILCEGTKIEKPLIFFAENILYIFFSNGNNLFYTTSSNSGESFKKVQKYKSTKFHDLIKGKYIRDDIGNKSTFCTNELYLNKSMPNLIKIIPEIYTNFFPEKKVVAEEVVKHEIAYIDQELIDELETKIKILENKIFNYENELKEKNNKILNLTNLLSSRSE